MRPRSGTARRTGRRSRPRTAATQPSPRRRSAGARTARPAATPDRTAPRPRGTRCAGAARGAETDEVVLAGSDVVPVGDVGQGGEGVAAELPGWDAATDPAGVRAERAETAERRQQPAGPAGPERDSPMVPVRACSPSRSEVTRKPDSTKNMSTPSSPRSPTQPGVERHDGEDGHAAQPVEPRHEPEAFRSVGLHGRGRAPSGPDAVRRAARREPAGVSTSVSQPPASVPGCACPMLSLAIDGDRPCGPGRPCRSSPVGRVRGSGRTGPIGCSSRAFGAHPPQQCREADVE